MFYLKHTKKVNHWFNDVLSETQKRSIVGAVLNSRQWVLMGFKIACNVKVSCWSGKVWRDKQILEKESERRGGGFGGCFSNFM